MFDLNTNKFIFDNPVLWVDLTFTVVLLAFLFLVVLKFLKRKLSYIIYASLSLAVLLSWFFSLKSVYFITLICLISFNVVAIIINISDVRLYLANSLARKHELTRNSEKIFDRHALYQKIETAVIQLSKSRTGAIMTFEKNTELNDVIKSGTTINCPVTPELLLTIFYPGTRLHDGACVIRRDIIVAASVYYTPTTKPLTGKFGSRHRAAIGISEITDSVTVVVSEETGRISLAVGGELIPVNADNFLRIFEDYMLADDEKEENK